MRRTFVGRCAAASGWVRLTNRSVDYPELQQVAMWRSDSSEAPQPILVLGGSTGLERMSKICKDITNDAGCAGIELPTREPSADWMREQADLVVKFINTLYCPWVHVIGHSVGALLALQLAHDFPSRIGTVTLLDTPVVSQAGMRAADLRRALVFSETDPNVTDAEVDSMRKELAELRPRESDLSCASEDAALFKALLQGNPDDPPDSPRPEFWSLPHEKLASVMHPMLIVRPEKGSLISSKEDKNYYNTFWVKAIKSIDAKGHDDLFNGGAGDVAYEIDSFHKRYSIQHIVDRMWDEAKHRKLESAARKGLDAPASDSRKGQKQGKKKEKKG
ncbi:hypothetical protein DIPPA_24950 [Diplonema papillatum]|nr:hypothetical protein DIPPA_24950 [Diplonema papillatum]